VQIFTVRDPRAPLPPLMPLRDAGTRVISSNEASITISWTPPITNRVLQSFVQRDFDGTMTNYPVGPETTTGKLILSVQEKFLDSMLLLLMI